MRSRLIAAATLLVLLIAVAPAPGLRDSGVKGRIFDTTCYGPCQIGSEARPYAGEAKLVVRRLPQDRRVARDAVEDGRVRTALRPGHYRLDVKIPDSCWIGDSKQVEVPESGFERVRFEVHNDCIL